MFCVSVDKCVVLIGNLIIRNDRVRVGSLAERAWREKFKNSRAQETDWIDKEPLGKEKERSHGGANGRFQYPKQ